MKNIKDYLNLPYTFITSYIEDETGNYYYGRVLELDGCQSTGDTIVELYDNLKEAMEGWLKPSSKMVLMFQNLWTADSYSGKFNVRIPKSLHQKLSIEAEKEGVSLNQYVLYKLSI